MTTTSTPRTERGCNGISADEGDDISVSYSNRGGSVRGR